MNLRPLKSRSPECHKSRKAFTLLEMMLVVAIIALLLAAGVKFMFPNFQKAQTVRVHSDLDTLTTALRTYQMANGFLPTTEQGLNALVTRPDTDPKPTQWTQGMEKLPLDPWQQPYQYKAPGDHNPNSFDLFSMGPDMKAGTPDDVGNWDQ